MKDLDQTNIQYLLNLIAQAIKDGKDSVTVSIATLQDLGIVKPDGTTITINNGVISANLPTINIATTSAVGIAKPDDDTLIIDSNGTLSLNDDSYTMAQLASMWQKAKGGGFSSGGSSGGSSSSTGSEMIKGSYYSFGGVTWYCSEIDDLGNYGTNNPVGVLISASHIISAPHPGYVMNGNSNYTGNITGNIKDVNSTLSSLYNSIGSADARPSFGFYLPSTIYYATTAYNMNQTSVNGTQLFNFVNNNGGVWGSYCGVNGHTGEGMYYTVSNNADVTNYVNQSSNKEYCIRFDIDLTKVNINGNTITVI